MQEKITNPQELRYNIALKLASYPPRDRRRFKRRIIRKCNVSESTISRWIHLKKEDTGDIPGRALIVFADCLKTNVENLLNQPRNENEPHHQND